MKLQTLMTIIFMFALGSAQARDPRKSRYFYKDKDLTKIKEDYGPQCEKNMESIEGLQKGQFSLQYEGNEALASGKTLANRKLFELEEMLDKRIAELSIHKGLNELNKAYSDQLQAEQVLLGRDFSDDDVEVFEDLSNLLTNKKDTMAKIEAASNLIDVFNDKDLRKKISEAKVADSPNAYDHEKVRLAIYEHCKQGSGVKEGCKSFMQEDGKFRDKHNHNFETKLALLLPKALEEDETKWKEQLKTFKMTLYGGIEFIEVNPKTSELARNIIRAIGIRGPLLGTAPGTNLLGCYRRLKGVKRNPTQDEYLDDDTGYKLRIECENKRNNVVQLVKHYRSQLEKVQNNQISGNWSEINAVLSNPYMKEVLELGDYDSARAVGSGADEQDRRKMLESIRNIFSAGTDATKRTDEYADKDTTDEKRRSLERLMGPHEQAVAKYKLAQQRIETSIQFDCDLHKNKKALRDKYLAKYKSEFENDTTVGDSTDRSKALNAFFKSVSGQDIALVDESNGKIDSQKFKNFFDTIANDKDKREAFNKKLKDAKENAESDVRKLKKVIAKVKDGERYKNMDMLKIYAHTQTADLCKKESAFEKIGDLAQPGCSKLNGVDQDGMKLLLDGTGNVVAEIKKGLQKKTLDSMHDYCEEWSEPNTDEYDDYIKYYRSVCSTVSKAKAKKDKPTDFDNFKARYESQSKLSTADIWVGGFNQALVENVDIIPLAFSGSMFKDDLEWWEIQGQQEVNQQHFLSNFGGDPYLYMWDQMLYGNQYGSYYNFAQPAGAGFNFNGPVGGSVLDTGNLQ